MAKCDVQIMFDREDRIYEIGEQVGGIIRIQADEPVHCHQTTLTYQCRTHGKGNRDIGDTRTIVLEQDIHFVPGETFDYPFAFKPSKGPVSYHGFYINVDWYVSVRLDVPWSVDPKAEEEFLLIAGEQTTDIRLKLSDDGTKEYGWEPSGNFAKYLYIAIGVIFCLVGLGFILTNVWDIPDAGGVGLSLIGLITFVFGIIAVFLGLRNIMASKKLGDVRTHISPEMIYSGDNLTCHVQFQPQQHFYLEEIKANFEGRESAVSGSGTRKTTYTHTLHKEAGIELFNRHVMSNEDIQTAFSFTIPADAPCTFIGDDNQVIWEVKIQISIKNWPDWVEEVPVKVFP